MFCLFSGTDSAKLWDCKLAFFKVKSGTQTESLQNGYGKDLTPKSFSDSYALLDSVTGLASDSFNKTYGSGESDAFADGEVMSTAPLAKMSPAGRLWNIIGVSQPPDAHGRWCKPFPWHWLDAPMMLQIYVSLIDIKRQSQDANLL